MNLKLWPEKDPLEKVWLTYDFSEALSYGETITATEILISLKSGADPSPGNVLDGVAQVFANGRVLQKIKGGLDAVSYLIRCKATLSSGRILLLAGVVPVKVIA